MENADKWFAIVNPVAGSGRGLAADWALKSGKTCCATNPISFLPGVCSSPERK